MTQTQVPNRNRKRKTRWIFAGVVIAITIIGLSLFKLGDEMVYFFTPEEAVAKAATLDGDIIKVGGMVKVDSVKWNPQDLDLNFTLTNMKGVDITIHHKGTPPDLFKAGSGVVVEGRIDADGKAMTSRKLMVKHSEEYRKPTDQQMMDKTLIEHSLFKQ